MAILKQRVVISTGKVKSPAKIHAPKFPEKAYGRLTAARPVGLVWWSPLAKLRSLNRSFEVVNARRSPDNLSEVQIEVSGSGTKGKAAILVYAEGIPETAISHGATDNLDPKNAFQIHQNNAGVDSTLTLPRAGQAHIGLEYIIQVNGDQTIVLKSKPADTIVRIDPNGNEEDGDQLTSQASGGNFVVVASHRRNVWTIDAESKDTDGKPVWTLT